MPQKKPGKPPVGPGRALGPGKGVPRQPKPISGGIGSSTPRVTKPGPGYAKPLQPLKPIKKKRP